MNKVLIGIGVAAVAVLGWYWFASMPVDPRGEPVQEEDMAVQLFYYDAALDQGPGGAQCTSKGMVAVERTIPRTQTPLKDTIELLLSGNQSEAERAQGLTTEFPLDGVALKSAVITDGVATLTFTDPQNKTSGGSCRISVLRAQIEATATQFPSVISVRILPEELFQP